MDVDGDFRLIRSADEIEAKSLKLEEGGEVWAGPRARARHADIVVKGKGSVLFLSEGCYLFRTGINIMDEGNIVFVGERCRIKAVQFFLHSKKCVVALGPGTTWESGSAICMPEGQSILIGPDCMISNNVMIRTDDGHGIFDLQSRERVNPPASVVLENHVWIGNGARCNKGVRVGVGTIVGGASIASGTLDPHSVYAGVPARKKRSGVAWSRTGEWDNIPEALRPASE